MPAPPRTVWKLSGSPAAAGLARSRIRAALAAWGLEACAEDAVLMASELVANAAVHGSGPIEVTLRIRRGGADASALVCEVTDRSLRMPRARIAGPDAVSGRGLTILAALSSANGVRRTWPGKTAWFEIALPPSASQAQPASPAPPRRAGQRGAGTGWRPLEGAGLRPALEQARDAERARETVMGHEAEIG
jgi:anti-sigma regulatory factor (Ser/Thr protein kinase)